MSVVEAVGLVKRYGRVLALDNVSLAVGRGEMLCLLGPNGAGKTTLIESLLGLRRLDAGTVRMFGEEVRGPLRPELARRVGTVLEGQRLLETLTVVENVKLMAAAWGVKLSMSEVKRVLETVGAWEFAGRLYGRLSTGQRKRADIAAALALNPELLILDEPEAGLDPVARLDLMEALQRLNRDGLTVMFSTHVLELAARFARRVAVIVRGRIVADGDPTELAVKAGGRWRVKAVLTTGEAYEAEFDDVAKAAEVLRSLGRVRSASIEPPSLEQVLRRHV